MFYSGGNKRGGKRDRANEMAPNETNITTWQTFEETSLYKHGYSRGHAPLYETRTRVMVMQT